MVALTTLACLTLLAACGGDDVPAGQLNGVVLDTPYQVPATPLTDTEGNPYSLVRDTDKPLTLVFFGYTHCPDICGVVMGNLAAALTRLDEEDRAAVDVVFVTTDPARDTGSVLRTYLDRYEPSFIGLTGDLSTIVEVAKPLAVYVSDGEKLPSGGYDLNTHSTQVTGIDSDDVVPVLWTMDTSTEQFADDIHTLLAKGN